MIYKWLVEWSDSVSGLNVFRYITFRTFLAFFTTFVVCWLLGPHFIGRMVRGQLGQQIRDDGPESHKKKAGTPTMGGMLILISLVLPVLLWCDLANSFVLSTLVVMFGYGAIGYADDYLKVIRKNHRGLSGKVRLAWEFLIAGAVIAVLIMRGDLPTELTFPFIKNYGITLDWMYVIFGSLVVVGCANAVNLTDGLDGLAIVPVIIAAGTFMVFAYVTGHVQIAHYLQILHVPEAAELAPLAGAVVAGGLGFLWFNAYPAQVFMGDVGSLSLGGFLGILAVLTKNELLMVVIGGVFVVEALSVISQVISFKLTGKRIFRMAPIHHHFELGGLVENKIIVRFWIISLLLALVSLSTLKLR